MQLFPAILTASVSEVQSQVDLIAEVGGEIETVQIDIIDGEFADNLTVSAEDLHDTNFHDFSIDFHLMTNEPIDFVFECAQFEHTRAILAQVEHMSSQAEYITEVRHFNKQVGLCLDLYTPVSSIDDESWDKIDCIQLMGIQAGFQRQEMHISQLLEKLQEVQKIKKDRDFANLEILVDGGVETSNVRQLAKAGVVGVAAGSALWDSQNLSETINVFLAA